MVQRLWLGLCEAAGSAHCTTHGLHGSPQLRLIRQLLSHGVWCDCVPAMRNTGRGEEEQYSAERLNKGIIH